MNYRITTQRLIVDHGVVGKSQERIPLFRVKDVRVKKSLAARTRGVGPVCGDRDWEGSAQLDDLCVAVEPVVAGPGSVHACCPSDPIRVTGPSSRGGLPTLLGAETAGGRTSLSALRWARPDTGLVRTASQQVVELVPPPRPGAAGASRVAMTSWRDGDMDNRRIRPSTPATPRAVRPAIGGTPARDRPPPNSIRPTRPRSGVVGAALARHTPEGPPLTRLPVPSDGQTAAESARLSAVHRPLQKGPRRVRYCQIAPLVAPDR